MNRSLAAEALIDPWQVRSTVMGQLRGVLAAFFGVIILGLIPIAGTWYGSTLLTWTLVLGWIALFAAAYTVQAQHLFSRDAAGMMTPAVPPTARTANILIMVFMIIGAAGAIAVVFDFAVLRNYGFTTSAATIRLEEVVASLKGLSTSSPISGAGRLAIPAFVPAVCLSVIYWKQITTATKVISAVCLTVLLFEQFRFEGGRFFLTAMALCAVLTAVLSPALAAQRKSLFANRKLLVRLAILGALMFAFFTYVFIARIADRDGFFWSAFINYTGNFFIEVDRSTIRRFDGFFGGIWYSITMLWLYATQGVTEFDQIVRMDYFQHADGGYQLLQLTQISDSLFGTNLIYDRFANLPHMGTYVTMPGSMYIDFGPVVTLLSGAAFGLFAARSAWLMVSGRIGALALTAPILLTCAFLASIVSLVQILWPALAWCMLLPILRSQIEPSDGRRGRRGRGQGHGAGRAGRTTALARQQG